MYKRITISVLTVMLVVARGSYLSANMPSYPLRKSEILALVAGGMAILSTGPANAAVDSLQDLINAMFISGHGI